MLHGISARELCTSLSMETTTSRPSGEGLPPLTVTEKLSLPDSPRTYHLRLLDQPSESSSSPKDTYDLIYLNNEFDIRVKRMVS